MPALLGPEQSTKPVEASPDPAPSGRRVLDELGVKRHLALINLRRLMLSFAIAFGLLMVLGNMVQGHAFRAVWMTSGVLALIPCLIDAWKGAHNHSRVLLGIVGFWIASLAAPLTNNGFMDIRGTGAILGFLLVAGAAFGERYWNLIFKLTSAGFIGVLALQLTGLLQHWHIPEPDDSNLIPLAMAVAPALVMALAFIYGQYHRLTSEILELTTAAHQKERLEAETQRRRAEDALSDLADIISTGKVGTFVFEPESGRFFLSDVARELFDQPEDEYPDLTLDTAIREAVPEYRDSAIEALKNTLANPGQDGNLLRYAKFHRDGTRHYYDVRGRAQRDADGVTRMRATVVEVTELIEMQQRLEREQREQQKMFSIIAHELRTPAAAIDMMLNNGADTGFDEDETRAHLTSASRHLLNVIDDLRVAINPEETVQLHNETFSLKTLLHQIERQIAPLSSSSGIVVNLDYKDPGDQLHLGDDYRLRAIISNLLRNAFTHSGASSISLRLRVEPIDETKDRVVFTVEDNGSGIDASEMARLFAPFERGASRHTGTGVGLFIVKKWLTLMGGAVNYRRSAMGGACFEVALPLLRASPDNLDSHLEASASVQRAARSWLKDRRVLVVEDDPVLRKVTARQIQNNFGCAVITANDGAEALKILEQTTVDLLITDYFMPGIDGKELISRLRRDGVTLPIIALTAATIGREQQDLIDAGADAVLAKPLNDQSFTQAILQIADPIR